MTNRIGFNLFNAGIVLLAFGGLGGSLQFSRLVIVLFLIAFIFQYCKIGHGRNPVYRNTYTVYGLILLFGSISLIISGSWEGLSLYIVVMLSMITITMISPAHLNLNDLKSIRNSWIGALLLTLPFAVFELATGGHFLYSLEDRNIGGEYGQLMYASVFFGNYNNYSLFLCLCYPFVLESLDEYKNWTVKLFLFVLIIITATILIINSSRVALVFVGLYSLVWVIQSLKRIVLFLVLLLCSGWLLWTELEPYLSLAVFRFTTTNLGEESTSARLDILRVGITQLIDTLGIGSGMGGFREYLQRGYPNLIPNAHNLFLELAMNFTLYALVVFSFWLIYLFIQFLSCSNLSFNKKLPFLMTIVFMPILGSINSEALGYSYWWYWFATACANLANSDRVDEKSGNT